MASSIHYKETLFKQTNLTPIHGKPNFETIHKLQNKIKTNAKSVESNLIGGSHGHLDLLLSNMQYVFILNSPFVYPTHLGPLVIPEGTTSHMNSNMRISYIESVCLFCEVTELYQALIQNISSTVVEAYLVDNCNQTTNLINSTVANVLTHLQEITGI